MKIHDYIVSFIANKNIKTIFTIPGGGCIFLSDAFAREKSINVVANHHEQACALAAEGYARISGKLGVCLVTSGPGGSNAWTGTLCSYQDSVPVMVISGNVEKKLTTNFTNLNLRQLGDQEFNVVKTVQNFTKYAVQINDPLTIKYHLEKAYYLALNGRCGPVWIDIPLDIQISEVNPDILNGYDPEQTEIKKFDIKNLLEKLLNSKKPLIIVGHGVRLSKSIDILDDLLELHKIPVITSFNGNDAVSNEYEYYCGRFGTHAQISANKIVQSADFVLSLGSRLYVRQIGYRFSEFAKNAYKIYVDIDNDELFKPTIFPDMRINLDVKEFLAQIKDLIQLSDISEWQEFCKEIVQKYPTVLNRHRNIRPLNAYGVIESLNDHMRSDLPVITSNGSANIVGMQVLKLKKNQRLFSNKSTAPMGYGLPAAIGACFAINKKQILCLEGDGSIHMNIHELQVVVQNNLPIKIIVFNNDGYLSIKISQRALCNGHLSLSSSSSGLTLPNYKKIAKAYGISYKRIKNMNELKKELSKSFNTDIPEFIEVFVEPDGIHEPRVLAALNRSGKFEQDTLDNIKWLYENI